ncbi:glucosyltransferase domain-containing protein [Bacillus sp. FJAT-29790]|uniref:glucosyltransferase domain-containing protein n=1 Tax=Bacillus sp. FJAT-29790 TaxID=1895002 RepID=UPI001C2378B8|nr:glucosyltransferase domain-containing protein [Bacillus sp. FJAT-29790]MBU8881129.1 glucosyltransferase domain-containing protein [Bacillus sp. FJAT-29790]
MPEDFFRKWKMMIKKEWKIAFISAAIIGFLTHMYVFTNMLPNHDSLINIYNTQLKFKSGRFFLGPFSGISSFFDLPWIIGILSVLYLALVTVVLTEFFELRKTPAIMLTAGLVMTFPTVAATFSYMFTADGYMMGFLLALLAVLVTKKYRFGFLPASFIFYLSVGIYQANLTIVLTVIAVWFIRELTLNEQDLKALLSLFFRFVSMTAIGMILYAITFKAYQTFFGGKITDYQGLDQIGKQSGSIIDQFVKIKSAWMNFFFRGFITDFPVNFFEVLNLLLFGLIVLTIVISIIQNKMFASPLRIIFIVASILMLPVCSFILYFVSPGVEYHMLMVMGLAFLYMLPIVLYDRFDRPTLAVKWTSWGTVVVIFLIAFNFAIINNIAYFNMTLKYEKTYAFMNRILDRIEQTDGFEHATKLAIIGRVTMRTEMASEKVPNRIPSMTGAMGETFLAKPYHFEYMLANQFGKTLTRLDDDELKILQGSELVKQMQTWPGKNSVRIDGDTVIIKLSQ